MHVKDGNGDGGDPQTGGESPESGLFGSEGEGGSGNGGTMLRVK